MAHDDKGAAQKSAVILPLFRVASTTLTASLSLHSRLCAQKRNRVAPARVHDDQRAAALTSKQWPHYVSMIKNLRSAPKHQSSHKAEQQRASRKQQDE
jgi:hypothetical protein